MSEYFSVDERRRYILNRLSLNGRVRVSELSRKLAVSEVTIRNDLNVLALKGRLERVSGGAVATLDRFFESGYLHRKTKNANLKRLIAEAVAQRVKDGETIMINSGTTSLLVALSLQKRKNLNVLTNSIAIAFELGVHPTIRVILLGGKINAPYGFTYGADTIRQLSLYKSDKSILSVDGVAPGFGLTTYHAEEAEINQAMIERSDQVLIVADSSKLGHESFNHFAGLSERQTLITDAQARTELIEQIKKEKINVILAD